MHENEIRLLDKDGKLLPIWYDLIDEAGLNDSKQQALNVQLERQKTNKNA